MSISELVKIFFEVVEFVFLEDFAFARLTMEGENFSSNAPEEPGDTEDAVSAETATFNDHTNLREVYTSWLRKNYVLDDTIPFHDRPSPSDIFFSFLQIYDKVVG